MIFRAFLLHVVIFPTLALFATLVAKITTSVSMFFKICPNQSCMKLLFITFCLPSCDNYDSAQCLFLSLDIIVGLQYLEMITAISQLRSSTPIGSLTSSPSRQRSPVPLRYRIWQHGPGGRTCEKPCGWHFGMRTAFVSGGSN